MRIDPDDFEPELSGPTDEELEALEKEGDEFLAKEISFHSNLDKLDEILEKNEELLEMSEDLSRKLDILMQAVNGIRRK